MNKVCNSPLLPGTPKRFVHAGSSTPVGLLLGLCVAVLLYVALRDTMHANCTPVAAQTESKTVKQGQIVEQTSRVSQRASLDPSLCTHDYSVLNWEGEPIKVCDPAICSGRDALTTLPAPTGQATHRWTPAAEAAYLASYHNNSIEGWMHLKHMAYVKALTQHQHSLGIYGSVGEIGVHHGKFFMVLAGNALTTEPCVAMDLFADQKSNIDGSGLGSMEMFIRHTQRLGLPTSTIDIWPGNSMKLTAGNISARGHPKWRLLSVDGGHSLEITLHDLMLASCSVMEGAVVVLDDVTNPEWLGVMEAMSHWAHAQQRLVPFLLAYNKMYFTTASHARRYSNFVASRPEFGCQPLHESRRTLSGATMCYGS